jgi:hypothetical protein
MSPRHRIHPLRTYSLRSPPIIPADKRTSRTCKKTIPGTRTFRDTWAGLIGIRSKYRKNLQIPKKTSQTVMRMKELSPVSHPPNNVIIEAADRKRE